MNSLGLQPDMLIEIDYKTDYIANQTRFYSNIARKLVETKKLAEEEVFEKKQEGYDIGHRIY